jgi:serine/threonine-protein kinase RsbW
LVHQIDVRLVMDGQAIVLTFDDDGRPFDPLAHPDPRPPETLSDAPVGGLGLLLVRQQSTRLSYERTPEGKNRLTVTIDPA